MKILFIVPIPMLVDRGGAIRVYEELLELKRRDIDICCVTYHLGRDVREIPLKRIPYIPFYKKEDPGGSYHRIYLDFLLFLKSLIIAIKMKPDIIHGHLHEGALCGILIKKLLKIPVLMDAQGSLTGEMVEKNFIKKRSVQHRLFRILENYIYEHVDKIVVSSQNLRKSIRNEFGVDVTNIEYITDGVNTNFFNPEVNSDGVIKKYNLKGKIVVIYTGVLTKFQGVDLLIESVPKVINQKKGIKYLIIGFPNVKHYKEMTEKLGISKYIRFTGKQSYFDIPRFLSAGDIAVSPKVPISGEANLKLFTYMAAGLPSVVLDTEDNRNILKESGMYCNNTPESLAEGILKLVRDGKLREKMGTKAREIADKEYQWSRCIEKLIDVYHEILYNRDD